MKVFLSWSGDLSKEIALAFKDFLKLTIQMSDPWMSSARIDSGEIWSEKILSNLSDTNFGILFLTAENKDRPWVLFEAGALMKQFDKAKVCPLLIDLEPVDLQQPLAFFQASVLNREGVMDIVKSVNNTLGQPLEGHLLEASFNAHWKDFQDKYDAAKEKWKNQSPPPRRTTEDMVEEILLTVRGIRREQMEQKPIEKNVAEILGRSTDLSQLNSTLIIPENFPKKLKDMQQKDTMPMQDPFKIRDMPARE